MGVHRNSKSSHFIPSNTRITATTSIAMKNVEREKEKKNDPIEV